jgi:hypothetical protein
VSADRIALIVVGSVIGLVVLWEIGSFIRGMYRAMFRPDDD